MTHRGSLLLVAFALLGACATGDQLALANEPNFGVGYADGCSTASEEGKSFSTKRARDEYLFANDDAYKAGWRQGYIQCDTRSSEPNDGGRLLGQQNEY